MVWLQKQQIDIMKNKKELYILSRNFILGLLHHITLYLETSGHSRGKHCELFDADLNPALH